MVRLDCHIRLQYRSAGPGTFLLNVQPAATAQQHVLFESLSIDGAQGPVDIHHGPHGTRIARFVGSGDIRVDSSFGVRIEHVFSSRHSLIEQPPSAIGQGAFIYMLPSRYCESDKILPFAQREFGWRQPGYERVLAIADWIRDHVTFRSGTSDWRTSAMDVLGSRQGVCRDFAHLMIATCRALNMPARFVTGVDYGADPALGPVDFHAYVEVLLGNRWYLFDPTGISPTTGLLRLGTGRDAADVPFATIYGSVQSWAPSVSVTAHEDAAAGLGIPHRTVEPVSTAHAFTDVTAVAPVRSPPETADALGTG